MPLIASYFRRARSEMPPALLATFETHGLSNRHGAVLFQVLAADGISVGELARHIGVSMTNASQLVGDLTRAGWLNRTSDPADHRRTLLSLAPGRQHDVLEFVERRSDPLLRAVAQLTPAQRAGFLAGLEAWVAELAE
jgi:DNA-binding MarR family transcriptional regulator